ncbi:Protein groucho-2 [Temnothorax longispinosus]|uniref:Protein groucho-2 n=1 Tax=Temnothorax longispinosus TaxID=300112 RepID=A0A4S2KNB4_9HYME|nr:Protein groucho-2 [Temnothorax longispinosus]
MPQSDIKKYISNVKYAGTEIAKRLNAIVVQILPFLSQEHQQQVASALDRAKQVTMTELNTIIGPLIYPGEVERGGYSNLPEFTRQFVCFANGKLPPLTVTKCIFASAAAAAGGGWQ